MYERPHEARHQHGVVSTNVAGVLLLDQRIHQHLEGRLGLGSEVIIFCGRLDESPEHHPVVGRMGDAELHVRPVHRFKADAAMPVFFPGIREGLPELAEPFFRYRRQQ